MSGSQRLAHALDDPAKARTVDVMTEHNFDKTFRDLHLKDKVLKGIEAAGFKKPSPIQWSALPLAKIGLDLVVQSKSGTGKTLVYAATVLNMVNVESNGVQAVVICPTREIAVQGARTILDIAATSMPELKASTLIGGMSVSNDAIKLTRCHVVVGTPGRIKQMVEEGHLKTESVRLFCLDEADKMMEKAFKNDVTFVYNKLPSAKQVLALSATYPPKLASMLDGLMRNPQHVRLDQDSQVLLGLDHYAIRTPFHPKPRLQLDLKFKALLKVLSSVTFSQALVFTNYSLNAEAISEKLTASGWPAIYIAAALQDQEERLRVMSSLKQFSIRILVTTDLSARGIDASNVTMVVNYDVPWDSRTFLHRCGRAGRFGSRGLNVSLASEGQEEDALKRTVFRTGTKIKVLPSSDDIPDLWKLESETDKAKVEALKTLDGLECEKEETEDEYYKVVKESAKVNAEGGKVNGGQKKEKWSGGNGKKRDRNELAKEAHEAAAATENDDVDYDYYDEEGNGYFEDENGYFDEYEDDAEYHGDDDDGQEFGDEDIGGKEEEEEDDDSPFLDDDFIIKSFAAITGYKPVYASFHHRAADEMTHGEAVTVIKNLLVSTAIEPKPFGMNGGKCPDFHKIRQLAEKLKKHQSVFERMKSGRFSWSEFQDLLDFDEKDDFKEELAFCQAQNDEKKPKSEEIILDSSKVLKAVEIINGSSKKAFDSKIEAIKEQLEYSKFSLQEAVDYVVANGDLPPVPAAEKKEAAATEAVSIAEPESSSTASLGGTPKKSLQSREMPGGIMVGRADADIGLPRWEPVSLDEVLVNGGAGGGTTLHRKDFIAEPESSSIVSTSPLPAPVKQRKLKVKVPSAEGEEIGGGDAAAVMSGLPSWQPVPEDEVVLTTAKGPILYQREETEGADGADRESMFPDPDEGLGDYLGESQQAKRLKRQFNEWWGKIQANKRLIAHNEFHTQMAQAEMRHGRKFPDADQL